MTIALLCSLLLLLSPLVSAGCNCRCSGCPTPPGPPVAPPVEPPVTPPVTPPVAPVAPAPTAICTVATFDAGYTCISTPASGLVCSQRAVTCAASIAGNANSTEAGECLLNSISASSNTVDCDYEANVQTCCGVNVVGLACTNQNECPENYVCTGDPGTCSGIEGAGCNATQQCSYAYNCVAGTCTNAASDAFQAPALVNNCTDAPSLTCNSTFSVALREDNELASTLVCEDPLTPYAPGNSVAFFYLPTSTLTVNTYNVSFSVYAPNDVNFSIRQLLPCTAGTVCGAALTPQQPALNLFQYNEIVTLDTPGEQRGYILFGGSSFAPLNGYIVNVSVQCGYVVPENCQQVVRQSCTTSSDCPLSAPHCNTTLGACQTLIGGACNVTTDCAEAYGITCNVNSCTCVGTPEDVCAGPTYLTDLENCLFASGTPTNCTQAVAACYDGFLGTPTTEGVLVLSQFQQLATCSLGSFNPSQSCGISGCFDSFCNAASCPTVQPPACTNDADCTNAYPFCDTFNGVCTGAGGSPCNDGNDCGTRFCVGSSCTCFAQATTRCNTPQGRQQIETSIVNCLATKNGTCAQRMALCQTASYTPNGINNVTLISAINTCVAAASPPLCNAENCVISSCASPNNCLIDQQCTCGQCCQGSICSICPDVCTTSADCPNSRPICASNGRCTSNEDCGSPEPPVQPPKQITPLPNLVTRPVARESPTALHPQETEAGWLDWFWTLLDQQD